MLSRRPTSMLLLGAASGLSPFGMAIVVPSVQSIAEQFSAGYSSVQFVISAYLFGLALAQPVTGFLCDMIGRRPVMLWGFAIFVLASIASAFTHSLSQLILFRLLQAIGVSVGTVASRAIIQDTRGTDGAAETMSYIAAAMGLAPVVAPILGGWLHTFGGLQAVFMMTAFIGLLVFFSILVSLPETLPNDHKRPRLRAWFSSYGLLLQSSSFIGYTLMFGFVQGSFFTFLAVGAAVFKTYFDMGPQTFGLIWGTMAVAYVAGATLGGRATSRFGARPVLSYGVLLTLLMGWLLLASTCFAGISLPAVVLPLFFLMAAAGVVTPNALAGAVSQHPELAGTSSGLSSALGIVVGGTFTIIAGSIYQDNFMHIAGLIAFTSSMTALSWLIVHRHHKLQSDSAT